MCTPQPMCLLLEILQSVGVKLINYSAENNSQVSGSLTNLTEAEVRQAITTESVCLYTKCLYFTNAFITPLPREIYFYTSRE